MQGAGRQEIKGELASVGWKERAVLKDTFVPCSGKRVGPHKTFCQDEAVKGYLVDLLKELQVLGDIRPLSHTSIHSNSSFPTKPCGIPIRSFSYILDPTFHCVIIIPMTALKGSRVTLPILLIFLLPFLSPGITASLRHNDQGDSSRTLAEFER